MFKQYLASSFNYTYISFLPLIGLQIFLYKIWTKNDDFSSKLFIFFGFFSCIFFSTNNILFSFILWELISWLSYLLLRNKSKDHKNNIKDTKVIFLTNLIGGLSFAWATCILIAKCSFWSELQFIEFSINEILQLTITLSITILTKSSQFPFTWLTLTRKSSSLVSAYMHSATVVQMGVYSILQLHNSSLMNNTLFYLISISSYITLNKIHPTIKYR